MQNYRSLGLLDYEVNLWYAFVMRPLYHPRPEEMTVQGILYALSDPVRVRIFVELMGADCAKSCSTFVNVNKTPLAKSTLSQHFAVLRDSGLIRSARKGVELQNVARCADLKMKFGPMIKAILQAYQIEADASR
jgi:DNA-binding transcriptional ArsR family regulator